MAIFVSDNFCKMGEMYRTSKNKQHMVSCITRICDTPNLKKKKKKKKLDLGVNQSQIIILQRKHKRNIKYIILNTKSITYNNISVLSTYTYHITSHSTKNKKKFIGNKKFHAKEQKPTNFNTLLQAVS
ncbi:unnamed protein product [Meganyctiphanes norvegica]|uniref:Uncharacterized protein n=1 Tax=Meganyctiphanes norvegica TaxID=48144 RepID=A0AAV2QU65_MEGNR